MKIKKYIALGLLSVTLATPLWASAQSPDDLITQGLIESPLPQGTQSSYAKEYLEAERALLAGDTKLIDQRMFQAPETLYRALRQSRSLSYSRPETLQVLQATELLANILTNVKWETLKTLDSLSSLHRFRGALEDLASLGYLDALQLWERVQSYDYHKLQRNHQHVNAIEKLRNEAYQKALSQMAAISFKNPTLQQQRFMVEVKLLLANAKFSGYYGFQKDQSPTLKEERLALLTEAHKLEDLMYGRVNFGEKPTPAQKSAFEHYSGQREFTKRYTRTYTDELYPWAQEPQKALDNFESLATAVYKLSGGTYE